MGRAGRRRGRSDALRRRHVRGPGSPTVLADVREDLDIWREEVFGPVVCVRTVDGLDPAIASRYGQNASIFTSSLRSAIRIA